MVVSRSFPLFTSLVWEQDYQLAYRKCFNFEDTWPCIKMSSATGEERTNETFPHVKKYFTTDETTSKFLFQLLHSLNSILSAKYLRVFVVFLNLISYDNVFFPTDRENDELFSAGRIHVFTCNDCRQYVYIATTQENSLQHQFSYLQEHWSGLSTSYFPWVTNEPGLHVPVSMVHATQANVGCNIHNV